MDHDILLLLIGAGIAIVSATIAAFMQHLLSLREDRIKRERDREKEREDRIRDELVLSDLSMSLLKLLNTDNTRLERQYHDLISTKLFLGELRKHRDEVLAESRLTHRLLQETSIKRQLLEDIHRLLDERIAEQQEQGESF